MLDEPVFVDAAWPCNDSLHQGLMLVTAGREQTYSETPLPEAFAEPLAGSMHKSAAFPEALPEPFPELMPEPFPEMLPDVLTSALPEEFPEPAQPHRSMQTDAADQLDGDQQEQELFCCPITHEIMREPVQAPDGRVYERAAITDWLRLNGSSPFAGFPMHEKHLQPIPGFAASLKLMQFYKQGYHELRQKLQMIQSIVGDQNLNGKN